MSACIGKEIRGAKNALFRLCQVYIVHDITDDRCAGSVLTNHLELH